VDLLALRFADELLLAGAKQDNEDIIEDIFKQPGTYDINYRDSIKNTALHYAQVAHFAFMFDRLGNIRFNAHKNKKQGGIRLVRCCRDAGEPRWH
jgi:hypothetical protein